MKILFHQIFTYPFIQINIYCTMGCTPRMRLTCLVEIILNLCVWGMIFQCISVWKRTLFSSVDFPYQSRPKKAAGPIGPVWCGGEVAILCLRFHAIKRRTDAAKGLKWQCFCPVRCKRRSWLSSRFMLLIEFNKVNFLKRIIPKIDLSSPKEGNG